MPQRVVSPYEEDSGTDEEEYDEEGDNGPNCFVGIVVSTLMGLCFGFFFEKSHCYEPASIRGQFIFERWVMLKMFMGAVAASCLVFSLLSVAAAEHFEAVRRSFVPACSRGWVTGGVIGGALLGTGMCLGGACPGMVLPQVGTGVPNAAVTLAGGLLGALVYGLMEPALAPAVLEKGQQCSDDPRYFADVHLKKPFATLSLLLGGMCAAIAITLEVLVPFLGELGLSEESNYPQGGGGGKNPFLAKAWPPSLCGFLLGLLQLPCAFVLQDSLGSSTSYQCVTSQWLPLVPGARERFAYVEGFRCGIGVWWQVFYVGAAVVGALVSAQLSGTFPSSAAGLEAPQAFLGGFLCDVRLMDRVHSGGSPDIHSTQHSPT